MASKLKWAAFAVVGIVMVVFIMRSCRLYDKASELKGKHEALMLKYADLEMTMRQDLAAYQADIAARDEAIVEAEQRVAESNDKIKEKDVKILRLEKEFTQLGENIAGVDDKIKEKNADILRLEKEFTQLGENKDAKLINSQAQVSIWKEKFTLAQVVIAEKDAKLINSQAQTGIWKDKFTLAQDVIREKDNIIFELGTKYEISVKIASEWQQEAGRQSELHSVALERIKVIEKEWRGVRLGSTVKTYVIAAVGAGLVYSLVKK